MIHIKDTGKLRETILKNGYSFAEFARKLGVSRSCLDKIFRRSTIAPKLAKNICNILQTDFDLFFYIV